MTIPPNTVKNLKLSLVALKTVRTAVTIPKTMTIDMETFEMTLEVLGDDDEAMKFFETYANETKKDLESMREYM